ncbi:hypothetical protein Nepgr_007320 [Nepenthes gracilis]|uniref:Uncharacterized protein n=1 Tax=Nepenthes gracilis TaxID=150966 RepID=A0AAD3S6Y2_NEPGR|nr:hypothetical protein Nepgr_007320 [Nepenthes gracilis]
MAFQKEYLDLILVPSGLLLMFAYHLFLLYRYLHLPHTTVIGFENNDTKAWVERIMQASLLSNFPSLSSLSCELCYSMFIVFSNLILKSSLLLNGITLFAMSRTTLGIIESQNCRLFITVSDSFFSPVVFN